MEGNMEGNYDKFKFKNIDNNTEFIDILGINYDELYELSRLVFLNLFFAQTQKCTLNDNSKIIVTYNNVYESQLIYSFNEVTKKYTYSVQQKSELFEFLMLNYMDTANQVELDSMTIVQNINLMDTIFMKSRNFNRQIEYLRELLINQNIQAPSKYNYCPNCNMNNKIKCSKESPIHVNDIVLTLKNGDFNCEEWHCFNCDEHFSQKVSL